MKMEYKAYIEYFKGKPIKIRILTNEEIEDKKMSNYVREFGLEDYKAMIGDDEEELIRQVLEDHDDDYDELDIENEDRDQSTGDMWHDLMLSPRDFM